MSANETIDFASDVLAKHQNITRTMSEAEENDETIQVQVFKIDQPKIFEACYRGKARLLRKLFVACQTGTKRNYQFNFNAAYDPREHGQICNTVWPKGSTCLHFTLMAPKNHFEILNMLLVEFRDIAQITDETINKRETRDGFSALHLCAKLNYFDCLRILLEHTQVDQELKTADGSNALILACQRGNDQIVEYLLQERGINVNHRRNDGKTALGLSQSNEKIVKMLVKCGGIK